MSRVKNSSVGFDLTEAVKRVRGVGVGSRRPRKRAEGEVS